MRFEIVILILGQCLDAVEGAGSIGYRPYASVQPLQTWQCFPGNQNQCECSVPRLPLYARGRPFMDRLFRNVSMLHPPGQAPSRRRELTVSLHNLLPLKRKPPKETMRKRDTVSGQWKKGQLTQMWTTSCVVDFDRYNRDGR